MDTTRRKEEERKGREKKKKKRKEKRQEKRKEKRERGVEGGWGWLAEVGGEEEVVGGRPRRAEPPDSPLNRSQTRSIDIRQGTE